MKKSIIIILISIVSLGLGYFLGFIKRSVDEKFAIIDNAVNDTSMTFHQANPNDSFIDQILDLTIETASGESIELPQLYDSLAKNLPEDKDEELILVQKLKRRGFEVTH